MPGLTLLQFGSRLLHVNMGIPACYVQTLQFQEARMCTYQCSFKLQIQKKQQPANPDRLFSVRMALVNEQSQQDMRTPLQGVTVTAL